MRQNFNCTQYQVSKSGKLCGQNQIYLRLKLKSLSFQFFHCLFKGGELGGGLFFWTFITNALRKSVWPSQSVYDWTSQLALEERDGNTRAESQMPHCQCFCQKNTFTDENMKKKQWRLLASAFAPSLPPVHTSITHDASVAVQYFFAWQRRAGATKITNLWS